MIIKRIKLKITIIFVFLLTVFVQNNLIYGKNLENKLKKNLEEKFTKKIEKKSKNKSKNKDLIKNIFDHKILIYSKSTCIYCRKAQNLLKKHKIKYKKVEIDYYKHLELSKQTGQNTVPYVYIDDELIGGFRELEKWVEDKLKILQTKS